MKLGLAAAAICVALASPWEASAKELRLAHFLSPQHPYHPQVFVWFGEQLAKATNGELTVRVFPGGELGSNPVGYFDMAVDGIADITFFIHGYTAGKFPKSLIMELPGQINTPEKGPAALNAASADLADEYRRVKLLGLWNITPASLFTTSRPVRTLEDVKGLKIRVASKAGGEAVEAWGGTAVFLPVPELYNAMQTGVVDGALIDGGAALAFKLLEVSSHVTRGMDSTVTIFGLAMNRDSYAGLSAKHKAAIEQVAGLPLSEQGWKAWAGLDAKAFDLIAKTSGKELITLTKEQAAPFNQKAAVVRASYLDELSRKGVPAQAIAGKLSGN